MRMVITLRSTLTGNGNSCEIPYNVSNRSVWKLLVIDRNTWNSTQTTDYYYLKPYNNYIISITEILGRIFMCEKYLYQEKLQEAKFFYKIFFCSL